MVTRPALLLLSSAFATGTTAVLADEIPRRVEQYVTIPSLPGQPNKETTVRPSGALIADPRSTCGGVDTTPTGPPPGWTPPPMPEARRRAPSTVPFPSGNALARTASPTPGSTTQAVTTGPNHGRVRGVVTALEPGKSITLELATTRSPVIYELAGGAPVPPELRVGDRARLRVLLDRSPRTVDLVERVPE